MTGGSLSDVAAGSRTADMSERRVGPSGGGSLDRAVGAAGTRGAASLIVGLALWELGSRAWAIPFLPPFSTVLARAAQLTRTGDVQRDLAFSLANLAAGYSLAALVGVAVGLVMGRYRRAAYALSPLVTGMLASPKLLFVPLLYALFGVSRNAQIAVIFLSAVFLVIVNTAGAVRTVDPISIQMARSFGASRAQLFWKVLLPGSLPLTMAGLRLGMGRAVAGMINGEMFITVFGLGARLRTFGERFDAAGVFAVLLIVIAVAYVCTQAMRLAERRLTRWTSAHERALL